MPRDAIDLSTDDPRLLALADHLWNRRETTAGVHRPIRLDLRVEREEAGGAAGALTESWTVQPDVVELRLGQELAASADAANARVTGWTRAGLLSRDPGLVARLLLEVPVAVLLERRGYVAVHAGGVAGPRGAVVLRGAPGSGKSTLVTAAYLAGLETLGDESVLVARDDPDAILAAVRDPTLEPEAVRLLGLSDGLFPATERAGSKQRLDLLGSAHAARRFHRRVATVILGPRDDGPAQLEPLDPNTFVREFRAGAIPEERWAEPAPGIETTWSRSGAWRLSGAADLRGAVVLLSKLVGHFSHNGSRA